MPVTLDYLKEHLRVCANCGRGTFLRSSKIDLYCDHCWKKIKAEFRFNEASDYPFQAFSLLIWNKEISLVENLIYSLKEGMLPSAFDAFAERFYFERIQKLGIIDATDSLLVIPPSRRDRKKDHAYAWGEALSKVSKIQISSPFEFDTRETDGESSVRSKLKIKIRPQKQLSKTERFARQFKLKQERLQLPAKVIFVDDLITSGATALAAYKALKSPVNFEVWTIARRPKLACN